MSQEERTPSAFAAGTLQLGGDLPVRRLGFGAMRITGWGAWGEPHDRQAMRRLLQRAVELGVNLIDTADSYGPGISEQLIAEALYPYPGDLVIATKGGLILDGPWHWHPNGRPDHLKQACEASLRRLRLERIDLYQLHAVDPQVPIEESVGALAELRAADKIRHIGLSSVDAVQLARALKVAPIVSVQNEYNIANRYGEDVLAACEREGLAFIPWFPLATGALARSAGPFAREAGSGGGSPARLLAAHILRFWPASVPLPAGSTSTRAVWSLVGPGGRLNRLAKRHRAKPGQVALAWLLRRSPVMLPIPGTSVVRHLEENVAAAILALSERDFTALAG